LSLELFLLGQGQIDLAKRLRQTALQCDRQMKGLAPNASQTRLLGASKSLAALKYLVESDLSSALQVQIGFSDADGD
jgi:predicted lipoprotein